MNIYRNFTNNTSNPEMSHIFINRIIYLQNRINTMKSKNPFKNTKEFQKCYSQKKKPKVGHLLTWILMATK